MIDGVGVFGIGAESILGPALVAVLGAMVLFEGYRWMRRRRSKVNQPESVAVELQVSQDAAGYIRERGGRLYLWQEAVGKAWASDHMGFDDPRHGVAFSPVWTDGGVALMLAEDLDAPRSVFVRLRRVPRGLHVEWDGRTWGWRGDAHEGG